MRTFQIKTLQRTLALALLAPLPVLASDAVIKQVKGTGEVKEGAAPWTPAKPGQSVSTVASLRTGAQSAIGLLLADKSQLNLGANCEIALVAVKPGKPSESVIKAQNCTQLAGQRKETGKTRIQGPNDTTADVTGTEWLAEIGEQATVMTVLNGRVELANPQGSVVLGANEQGRAEKGKAPYKILLQNPRERVQWVNHYQVALQRYPELANLPVAAPLALVVAAIKEQRLGDAQAQLQQMVADPAAPAVVPLLLADFAIVAGQFNEAERVLQSAPQRDVRISAKRIEVALLADQVARAGEILVAAQAVFPDAVELQLAAGQLFRLQGQTAATLAAYRRALALAPEDARGYFGLGSAETEREDLTPARHHLWEALRLAEAPGYRGEMATLETMADNLGAARRQFQQALERYPNDYVALSGLGLLELKAGNVDTALEHLLAAQLIEPRYARTQIYIAIAYYQRGQTTAALLMLQRATEVDANDPVPHLLQSLIYQDLLQPFNALQQSRLALAKLPYLKSLNQVANDQKGSANLGSALALFGLEDWAMAYAQDSYDPFFGGSHFFFGERLPGRYNRQSELLQGYLTDPTSFGASNRFQSLAERPNQSLRIGAQLTSSGDYSLFSPKLTANGLVRSERPWVYFVNQEHITLRPGNIDVSADTNATTLALGAKPHESLNLLAVFDDFRGRVGQNFATGSQSASRVDGSVSRLDLGAQWQPERDQQWWMAVAQQREQAQNDTDYRSGTIQSSQFKRHPELQELRWRFRQRWNDHHALTIGLEQHQVDDQPWRYAPSARFPGRFTAVTQDLQAKTRHLYVQGEWSLGDSWKSTMGLAREQVDSQLSETTNFNGVLSKPDITLRQTGGNNHRVGLVWQPAPATAVRLANARWLQPMGLATLAPVNVAGLTLEDRFTIGGGQTDQRHLQVEWQAHPDTFVTAWVDRLAVQNPADFFGGLSEQASGLADFTKLRNGIFSNPQLESLEGEVTIIRGIRRNAGASVSQIINPTLSAYGRLQWSRSEQWQPSRSGAIEWPYTPQRQISLGLTWQPVERSRLSFTAHHRGQRYADAVGTQVYAPGWDGTLSVRWEGAEKRWSVEGFLANIGHHEKTVTSGLVVVWRE